MLNVRNEVRKQLHYNTTISQNCGTLRKLYFDIVFLCVNYIFRNMLS